jgi:hypothetical protein
VIQFGEWLPDQADIMNSGVTVATNVMPAAAGYHSMNSFVEYSNAADGTIRGIFAAKDSSNNTKLFAGDDAKLYLHNTSTNNLDDIKKVGGYDLTGGERWRSIQFGDYVIAAGGIGEELQYFELGTSSAFADLAGSPPKADFIAAVRDFVWVANVDSGTGRIPYRCQWSGFNDVDGWTVGTGQSDFQDLPDSGEITGLVGGEYATILTERAIFRATYTGPPLIWQFDKVVSERGCNFKNSVCNAGNLVFFLSSDGFYAFDGQRISPIGSERVNEFFLQDFDSNYADRMSASVDPLNEVAMWSYTSTQSPSGQPDKIIIYNYTLNKWSLAEVDADLLSPMFSAGYTVDALDNLSATVDGLSIQLDSRFYKGGQYFFGGAYGNKIYTFTGAPLAATIETAEAPISTGKHSIVTRVYPYYEDGSVTLAVGTRDKQSDTPTFTSAVAPNDGDFSPFRAQGRYHRARMSLSGAWSKALGIDVEARDIGRR